MKKSLLFSFLIIIASIFSCQSQKKLSNNVSSSPVKEYQKEGYESAIVLDKTGLDGCGFVLQIGSGKILEPLNLGSDFKKNNLAVWIKYVSKKNAVSICMSGEIITLSDIQLRK
ncbi:MAG TPA: hypothetical protein VNG53_03315 [Bacteroidia bacterium]|nr:hypothetical protein [Bacteroidia bacterium]